MDHSHVWQCQSLSYNPPKRGFEFVIKYLLFSIAKFSSYIDQLLLGKQCYNFLYTGEKQKIEERDEFAGVILIYITTCKLDTVDFNLE